MENNSRGLLSELFDSIKYYMDSKKGKYSLDTYLDIVSEYTDRQIVAAEKNGLEYMGGECSVKESIKNRNMFEFEVELYFKNSIGEKIKQEAKRELSKNIFVRETKEKIGTEPTKFQIKKPDGEK